VLSLPGGQDFQGLRTDNSLDFSKGLVDTESGRTHTFCAQDLLHHGHAVRCGFSATCACAGEDIAALEGEGDGFGLDESRTGEA
jgi:hypothetical protein